MAKMIFGQELVALNGDIALPWMSSAFLVAAQQTRQAIMQINDSGQYAVLTFEDREVRVGTLFDNPGYMVCGFNQLRGHLTMATMKPHPHLTKYLIDLTKIQSIGIASSLTP